MMIKYPLYLFLLLILSTATSGYARELFPASNLKLGIQSLYFDYQEPGVMSEKGNLWGAQTTWTTYQPGGFMFRLSSLYQRGTTKYNGSYSNGAAATADTDNCISDVSITVGQGMTYNGNIGITPYAGIGREYWFNDIKASGGYERDITHIYLPIGVDVHYQSTSGWLVGTSLEGRLLLRGTVKSKLSQANVLSEDAHNTQKFGSGGGARISAFAEYPLGGITVGIEPYFEYWHYAKSNYDYVLYEGAYSNVYEPKNHFLISGITLYITF